MDRTLAGLAWNVCFYYLDDIIVFSSTWSEHLERLRAVFEHLRRANLKLGTAKCHLAAKEVIFLGYKVTPEGLEPEPKLMEAISKLPPPISVAECSVTQGSSLELDPTMPGSVRITKRRNIQEASFCIS